MQHGCCCLLQGYGAGASTAPWGQGQGSDRVQERQEGWDACEWHRASFKE